jgi:hypothetical protein
MTKGTALPFLLLRAYPQWWRDRYGDEMEVMIESLVEGGRSSLGVALNLLMTSIGVWLRGTGAPPTREFWTTRTQRSLLVAVLPWFALVPLNVVFADSNSQDGAFYGSSPARLSGAGLDALDVQRIALTALILSLCLAVVGWQRMRGGLKGQDVGAGRFRVVNRLAMAGIVLTIAALFLSERNGTSTLAEASVVLGLGLLGFAWLSMPSVLVIMMREGRQATARLRSEVNIAIIMAGLNIVSTALVAVYLFEISRQPVPLPEASYLIYRSTLGNWNTGLVVGFVLLSSMSVIGAFSARQSYVRARAL